MKHKFRCSRGSLISRHLGINWAFPEPPSGSVIHRTQDSAILKVTVLLWWKNKHYSPRKGVTYKLMSGKVPSVKFPVILLRWNLNSLASSRLQFVAVTQSISLTREAHLSLWCLVFLLRLNHTLPYGLLSWRSELWGQWPKPLIKKYSCQAGYS